MNGANNGSNGTINLGFTGVGKRGESLLGLCAEMDDVVIPAICDLQERRLDATERTLVDAGRPAPTRYSDHEEMLAHEELDAVIIAPSWRHHIPMAIAAMRAGVTPGLEVGPASSIRECWDLVKTAEETGEHCMLLENGCFGRDRMAVLNMVRQGLFGELVHAECGYLHDIRPEIHGERETRMPERDGMGYRALHYRHRNADVYPTHGIGPIAEFLDINRGNRFRSLRSVASKSSGLNRWADQNLDEDDPLQDVDWELGDIVTTTIECANGETVVLKHDCSLPRPKGDMRMIQGTNGLWKSELDALHIEDESPAHEWEPIDDYYEEFDHPLWEAYRERGVETGHGGSDYLVLRSFIESVVQDVRPPIDVYDTATWMAISVLSERSIARGGDAVAFPDFTSSDWLVEEPIFGLTGDVGEDRLDFGSIL